LRRLPSIEIEKTNPKINAVTRILRDRAMQEAAAVDAQFAAGSTLAHWRVCHMG
jgi:Asp-tRNA(Asn)/Glu-tRNA(Gln) amidotransferase A subunit family amidase